MTILREALDAGEVDFTGIVDPNIPPLPPAMPGEILRQDWLDPLGITAYRLAVDIGVPPNRITCILNGERTITADTALRFARYFGTDAASWLDLQVQYDLARERLANGDEIAAASRMVRENLCHGSGRKREDC